jgi:transposase
MKAYSLDLRERIVDAVAQGMTKARAGRTFAVSLATVKNYVLQVERTGSLAPRPIPGRPREIPPEQEPALVAQLRATQDATLDELRATWEQETGGRVSAATLSRAIKRLKWTRKKRRWVPPNATP